MRSALMLLMLLGLAAIPGSLVPQDRVDAFAVSRWKFAHPGLTPLYERLGLFHVYGSVWFSAIYMLLMASLVGCILPRLKVYWRAAAATPPRAPRNPSRLPNFLAAKLDATAEETAERARARLRRQRYRVRTTREADGSVTIAAQRGYLREAGNLLFHLSVVLVLVSFAIGTLFGFRGGVIVVSGQTFTNVRQSYDDFAPGGLFGADGLEPFNLTLDDFKASFMRAGPTLGQPTAFSADLTYQTFPGAAERSKTIEVNQPLTIGNTSVFLVGNGYAPLITVRDGKGKTVYSGPTVFLPEDATYASWGVIKVPDAQPTQLGFEGQFLPTYGYDKQGGTFSQFPDTLAPTLSLTAYKGDLGLGSGIPQSVYSLNKKKLTALTDTDGKPLTLTIPMGKTRRLPNGIGTITFDGVRRWAKLQISATPAEPLALGGVVLGLIGLLASLYVRPRRIWLRARPRSGAGADVELAGLDRREGHGLDRALTQLLANIEADIEKAAT
ncbi:cytochrome c biogenesis protein ResB [Nocardioides taihuensis]|uniref:Cytochrome c biogenesis protein ResB n=1 Tax=Nocardioides taihuensis TaxID=1835606 RepID=A0ABW0BD46_9ACTN